MFIVTSCGSDVRVVCEMSVGVENIFQRAEHRRVFCRAQHVPTPFSVFACAAAKFRRCVAIA